MSEILSLPYTFAVKNMKQIKWENVALILFAHLFSCCIFEHPRSTCSL